MLSTYLTQTKQLLQLPESPDVLYPEDDLIGFINRARKQLAGEGDCIRVLGTLNTVQNQRPYNFSSVNVSSVTGVSSLLRIEQMAYVLGQGLQWFRGRPWPWFFSFRLSNAAPEPGPPKVWSQYAQGATGSFYLDPPPDQVYALTIDAVCLPIDLVDDTTAEAIPPLWQDCVCYFAAYLALLSSQSAQRQSDAGKMKDRYEEFVDRARKFSTPSANRYFYPQHQDPTLINKLGITPKSVQ